MTHFLGNITYVEHIEEREVKKIGVLVKGGVSYTEAEARITQFCREDLELDDFEIKTITKKKYNSFGNLKDDFTTGDFWEVKSQYSTILDTGKERFIKEVALVRTNSHTGALDWWSENKIDSEEILALGKSPVDFVIN